MYGGGIGDLHETLKRCGERAGQYRRLGQRVGEQNTKAGLVEPVLAALGWDVLDPDEVHREYRRRSVDNPVDYALLLARTPWLFIETKGLGENLDDPKWANQTISYAAVAGVEWVALTDGAEWRVYNAHAPVPVEQKLLRAVRITDDVDAACELLSLLGKDNLRDNRIRERWKSFFVDRQVRRVLEGLFDGGEPARDLLALVTKRLAHLNRVEVRDSLLRARATFDFPAVVPAPHPSGPPAQAAPAPAGPGGRSSRISAEERRVRLADLVRLGRIAPDAAIEASSAGQQATAQVTADGAVLFGEQAFRSLSAAGEAVKVAIAGPDLPQTTRATDGRAFWRATDPVRGDVVSLREIRRRAATEQPPDAPGD